MGVGVKATHHEELTLWVDAVATLVHDVEGVGDHHGLSHIVGDFVAVEELGSLLKVEDSGVNVLLERVFELEVSRKVQREELIKLLLHVVS